MTWGDLGYPVPVRVSRVCRGGGRGRRKERGAFSRKTRRAQRFTRDNSALLGNGGRGRPWRRWKVDGIASVLSGNGLGRHDAARGGRRVLGPYYITPNASSHPRQTKWAKERRRSLTRFGLHHVSITSPDTVPSPLVSPRASFSHSARVAETALPYVACLIFSRIVGEGCSLE